MKNIGKENFILSSTPIEISDFPNHKEATFLISVLGEYNSNDVLIQEEEGEKYHSTIVGYPILAHLKYDAKGKPSDFGGHELRKKIDPKTKKVQYYFATHAIGSVTESWIEERQVDGYEGEKKVILIKAKLWKSRFSEYFKVFDKLWDKGGISSSWEISSSEVETTEQGKILKIFEFIGNCLLGSNVQGAVKGAGVLEVASEDEFNYELSSAFLEDIMRATNEDNVLTLNEGDVSENRVDININNVSNEGGNKKMEGENQTQTSAITHDDLWTKVRRAINAANSDKYYSVGIIYPYDYTAYGYHWDRASQEDFVKFVFTTNSDDTVSITSQEDVKMKFVPVSEIDAQVSELQEKLTEAEKEVAEAGKAITELSKEKETLETQIATLTPFKEQVEVLEQAEKDRQLAEKKEELKAFTLEDELISSEELESNEVLVSIFAELSLENYEASVERVEIVKGKKAIEKFKLASQSKEQGKEKNEQEAEVHVSSAEKSVKSKTDLNDSESDAVLTANDIMKSFLGR